MSVRKSFAAAAIAAAGLTVAVTETAVAQEQAAFTGGFAVVGADGQVRHKANVTTVRHKSTGVYHVVFSQDVNRCAANATIRGERKAVAPGYIMVSRFDDKTLRVNTFTAVTLLPADFRFDVVVNC